jgi:bifunctional non-homologous end joining protein LigD
LLEGVAPPILYGDHVVGKGEALFEAICAQGGEGIISKKADAPYSGKRGRNWLKIKCTRRQEFVVVGWAESDKARGFRSLLLAAREGRKLTYAGKVGTGFTMKLMDDLLARMKPLEVDEPALEIPRAEQKRAHFLEPELVAEIAFTEFTREGTLRHPSFLGLREDKPAKDVVIEKPVTLAKTAKASPKEEATAAGLGIRISNPDRPIFPEDKLTKGDLADYYAEIAPLIMVDAADRPMTLIRCPQGRGKKCFFQKHDSGTFGEWVKHVPIKEKDGGTEDYLWFDDIRGLLSCVQM